MLYVHETHHVIGKQEEAFVQTMKDDWLPLIEADGSARLLWVWKQAHGTGPGYRYITLHQVEDWNAWGALADAYHHKGSALHDWYENAWKSRYKVESKLMTPVEWSPTPDLPPKGTAIDRAPTVYLHDVAYPFSGGVTKYIQTLGAKYFPYLGDHRMLSMKLCLRVAPGAGEPHEVVLVQKINDTDSFSRLLYAGEATPASGQPAKGESNWMEVGLTVRDQWLSQMFRTLRWSPLD